MNDPTKTIYGERNESSPPEMDAFSFLIGRWEGQAKTRLEDGKIAEFRVTWIGRYILDGTAIADEVHAVDPGGKPCMGISLRQYDRNRKVWIVEYLNVSDSFLRKQVNGRAGSVTVRGRNVTVASAPASPGTGVREQYIVPDGDNWVFRLDISNDGGRSWNEGQMEIALRRAE